jgi:hypothetical protein
MGTVITLYRNDSAQFPISSCLILRMPPVVGAGRPVRALKRDGGTVAWQIQNTFHATYTAKQAIATVRSAEGNSPRRRN